MEVIIAILSAFAPSTIANNWGTITTHGIGVVIGFGLGCIWYRRNLRLNPEKIEHLAALANTLKPVEDAAKGFLTKK